MRLAPSIAHAVSSRIRAGLGARLLFLLGLAIVSAAPAAAAPDAIDAALQATLQGLDVSDLRTGVLYDRVLPMSGIERFTGAASAPAADERTWRQIAFELRHAANQPERFPPPAAIDARVRAIRAHGLVPLALIDARYERIRPDAIERGVLIERDGRLARGAGDPFVESRAVSVAALAPATTRGGDVGFVLDRRLFAGDEAVTIRAIDVDFDDGLGGRVVEFDRPVRAHYVAIGVKTLTVRITRTDGTTGVARASFPVEALAAPAPDDTLQVSGALPYQGQTATGLAYVYLAPGHAAITNPIVVVEGFDLDNTMHWDELYAQLNQQNLLEDLRAEGYDAVVLDFTDATDYIQRNGFVVAALIRQVEALTPPPYTLAVVGASMGGLCSRYALDWLETQEGHRVRTWVSFDAPHHGADIPLGIQHWMDFFAGQSADAAAMRDALNRPASRQMLLYHFTNPPTTAPDPLHATLDAELAALGDYPSLPRRVAMANGSGARADQGFAPGAQLIRWEYSSFLVSITGNVWALPNQVAGTVFNGRITIFFSTQTQTVTATGATPWDGAPGGSRATMAQMESVAAPYGDIVALHQSHCFIPTISALALSTSDPFYDVAGDAQLLDHTPFDDVFYPSVNEPHVTLSPAGADWLAAEIRQGATTAPNPKATPSGLMLDAPRPNPFVASAVLRFTLPRAGWARLSIVSLDGRRVATLLGGRTTAGAHAAAWNGRDDGGREVPPGVYWAALETEDGRRATRLVRMR